MVLDCLQLVVSALAVAVLGEALRELRRLRRRVARLESRCTDCPAAGAVLYSRVRGGRS